MIDNCSRYFTYPSKTITLKSFESLQNFFRTFISDSLLWEGDSRLANAIRPRNQMLVLLELNTWAAFSLTHSSEIQRAAFRLCPWWIAWTCWRVDIDKSNFWQPVSLHRKRKYYLYCYEYLKHRIFQYSSSFYSPFHPQGPYSHTIPTLRHYFVFNLFRLHFQV